MGTPTPCPVKNRTTARLGDTCGVHGSDAICSVANSACLPNRNNSEWTCQCIPGFTDGFPQYCVQVYRGGHVFFKKVFDVVSISMDERVGQTVRTEDISHEVASFYCSKEIKIEIIGHNIPFIATQRGCVYLDIKVKDLLTEERDYTFGIQLSVYSNDILIVRDVSLITIMVKKSNDTLQMEDDTVIISNGTFSDTLVAVISKSYFESGDRLSLTSVTSILKINDDGKIYTSKNILLGELVSDITLLHFVSVDVFRSSSVLSVPVKIKTLSVVIISSRFITTQKENSPENSVVAKLESPTSAGITVTSPDLPDNVFKLQQGSSQTLLALGNRKMDYESGTLEYVFNIDLTFSTNNSRNVYTTHVTVNVEDVDDESPYFTQSDFTFEMYPNPLPRTFAGIVQAKDKDKTSVITYAITDVAAAEDFSIDNDGIIRTTKPTQNIALFTNISNSTFGQKEAKFEISASDGTFTGKTRVSLILVVLPQVNLGLNFTASVAENKPVNTNLISVFRQGYKAYEFTNNERARQFLYLDRVTGRVTTAKKFDYEQDDHSMIFAVIASKENEAICSIVILGEYKLEIIDENDNPPSFTRSSYYGSIKENLPLNSTVKLAYPIETMDRDALTTSLSLSLSGAPGFTIDSSGKVFAPKLDRESRGYYGMTLTVYDGLYSSSVSLNITVEDENDNSPIILNNPAVMSVTEGDKDKKIGIIQAYDIDEKENAKITFSFAIGNGFFQIDSDTGDVRVIRPIDRETTSNYIMTVIVRDSGKGSKQSNTTLIVNVMDRNDNAPTFNTQPLVLYIKENSPPSSSALVIKASDKDVGQNAEISFSGSYRASDGANFSIAQLGVLSYSGIFDFEATQSYQMEVIAIDKGSPPLNSTSIVTIYVQDVNDNAPVFSKQNYSATIRRSAFKREQIVLLVDAYDRDSNNNGKLSYSLQNALLDKLSIDSSTGLISTRVALAPDAKQYDVIVTATDGASIPSRLSQDVVVKVTVIGDEEEKSVVFTNNIFRYNISEEASTATEILDLKTKHGNKNNVKVEYSLPAIRDSTFIVSDVGVVMTNAKLDREVTETYKFVVKVLNTEDKTGSDSDLAEIEITVLDINDNYPQFLPDPAFPWSSQHTRKYIVTVKEDHVIGSSITNITAEDKDKGQNALIFFTLVGTGCKADFKIDESTGILSTVAKLDYETYALCSFQIMAFDKTSNPKTSSIDIDVNIFDVNDNYPVFDKTVNGKYEISILENARKTITFGDVSDADSRANGDFTVRISNSKDCPFAPELVESNGKTAMLLTVTSELDYETITEFSCNLSAIDNGQPALTSYVEVKINVQDVNDNAPEFLHGSITVNISRDAQSQESLMETSLKVEDKDSGENGRVTFHIDDDHSDGALAFTYFYIGSIKGTIRLRTDLRDLQRDKITITVIARDGGTPQLSSSTLIYVEILDDNVRPWFDEGIVNVTLVEEITATSPIFKPSAKDKNGIKTVDCTCSYRILNDMNVFTLTNGYVSMRPGTKLDRERDGSFVTLNIVAKDNAKVQKESRPMELMIKVIDINDNGPIFEDDKTVMYSIHQKAPIGTTIGKISARDPDEGENAVTLFRISNVVYSKTGLTSGVNATLFNDSVVYIHPTNGTLMSAGSLNIDAKETFYLLINVMAYDKKDESKSSTKTVVAEVEFEDPNMFAPMCHPSSNYSVVISRSQKTGETITTLSAKDNDTVPPNNIFTYSIIDGNIRDIFTIDERTGAIKLSYTIDNTIDMTYILLKIQVTDKGIRPKSSQCNVNIEFDGVIDTCILESDVAQQRKIITAEKDTFFIVMIVMVVAMCFFILTTAIFIYKYLRAIRNTEKMTEKSVYKSKDPYSYLEHRTSTTTSYSELSSSGPIGTFTGIRNDEFEEKKQKSVYDELENVQRPQSSAHTPRGVSLDLDTLGQAPEPPVTTESRESTDFEQNDFL